MFFIVLATIYGLGVMFATCIAMTMFARKWSENSSIKYLSGLPAYIFIGFILGLAWPIMLFKDPGFREAVVECGRIWVIFGYLFCVLMTLAYPWIWVWYILGVALWLCLDRYHYCWSVKPRE